METMKRVMMKKTKIICTIADNRCEEEFIRQLYENGMNVVRINSAHASIEGAWKIVDNVRKVSSKIGILIDTKGPEVRLTGMADAVGFVAHTGDIVEIIDDPSGQCTKGTLYTTYPGMSEDVPVGSDILIDDGSVDLSVIGKSEGKLVCKVMNEGVIKGHKSVNVPSVHINLPALTDKDRTFIRWAVDADIDFIAHSFVRSADDLKEIQDILDAEGSHLKIISKIENQQGIDNLDDILTASYGIMVARGDLGVEIPAERIPLVQKHIVQMCRSRKKPVIVATQMLQSMIDNPRPTRAEVTDIANAIFQSADAVMLSGESAYGKYPVEAVKTMTDIAFETEQAIEENLDLDLRKAVKPVAVVLARSLVAATRELPVKALVFDTYTGRVGRYLSTFRPKVPLYAMCYNDYTMRELALVFGVNAYPFGKVRDKEEFAAKSIEILIKEGKIRHGDLVGFIGGVFGEQVGATYMEIKYI
ncbi:MAG: pyruvate kinase [Bacteroidales bacterium]|nr:pyruvate kinase [Bacteroidales bacterium]